MLPSTNITNADSENSGLEKSESIEKQMSSPTNASVRLGSKPLNYIEDITLAQDERASDGSPVDGTSAESQEVDLKEHTRGLG